RARVVEDDGAVLAVARALAGETTLADRGEPLPQRVVGDVGGRDAREGQVGDLDGLAQELDLLLLALLARLGGLDDADLDVESRHGDERGHDVAVDLEEEVLGDDRVSGEQTGHGLLLRLKVRCGGRGRAAQEALCLFWLMRKMTNSAGFTGARPTSTMSLPSSIDWGVFVVSSQ